MIVFWCENHINGKCFVNNEICLGGYITLENLQEGEGREIDCSRVGKIRVYSVKASDFMIPKELFKI